MAEGPGFEPRLTQSGSAVLPLNQKPWERNVLMPTKWHCPAPETPMSPATVDREISRFPRKERLHMPGSLTTPGRPGACAIAPECVAFHHMHGVDTQNRKLSRLKGWPMRTPVNASPRQSRATAHELGADVDRYTYIERRADCLRTWPRLEAFRIEAGRGIVLQTCQRET